MKRIVLTLAILAILAAPALAEVTQRGEYTTPCPGFTQYLNENEQFLHVHDYSKYEPDNEYGVGVDVAVLDVGKLTEMKQLGVIEAQYKYDINNGLHKVYGVLKIDLTGK